MKAAVLEAIDRLVVSEVPEPCLEAGALILRVKVCSICSTDLRIYHHGHDRIKLPQILGHEIAGIITAVGEGVSGYRPGDRVAVTPRISCGRCFYCRRGQPIYCLESQSFGYQLPGGYAEYVLVPGRAVRFGVVNKVSDAVGFEAAALAEILACVLRSQRALGIGKGDSVLVIGGGPVGLIHCRLARASGAAQVILAERETYRLKGVDLEAVSNLLDIGQVNLAAEITRLTEGRGADVVIVACSSRQAQGESLALAGRGGRVDFFGGLVSGESTITLDSNLIHYREISLHGSHGSLPEDNREAIRLIEQGKVMVGDLVTHRFPLDDIEAAFRCAESREGMHVAVLP
jgi:L-iditol 2-dehydrogenase